MRVENSMGIYSERGSYSSGGYTTRFSQLNTIQESPEASNRSRGKGTILKYARTLGSQQEETK